MDNMIVNEIGVDCGDLLYEQSSAKTKLDIPQSTRWKKYVIRGYMILLMAGLLAWFLTSLVLYAKDHGFGSSIVEHLLAFFILLLVEAVLFLTAFGLWGKLFKKIARGNAAPRSPRPSGKGETALRIHPEHIVVINGGKKTVLSREFVDLTLCVDLGGSLKLTFCSYTGTRVEAEALLPSADLPILKKYLPDLQCTGGDDAEGGRKRPPRETDRDAQKEGGIKEKFPILLISSLCILIGVALCVVHFVVLPAMPVLFGLVFAFVGLILFLTAFDHIPVIARGIVPIMGGFMFAGLPIGVALTIADLAGLTLAEMLTSFTATHAVLAMFCGFGPMLLISGVAGIIECIRYGNKK